jgi:undecaprenyl-phosphate 4-deoxy-4-formamido-L-arabinose transferase
MQHSGKGEIMLTLSIVIPVYNAEKTIEVLCSSLVYLFENKYRLQIVLVNDGSKDNSDSRCRALHAAYPEIVTYIKLARNFGEHNAVMAGLNHATGDYCVIMDDDMQNPPEEIGRLVGEILKGYDVVYARYKSKKDGLFRNLGSAFNDRVATFILKKPVNLYLSSFKIMNRFLVKEIIKYNGSAPYIDAIVLRTTDSIGSLSLEHRHRPESKSGYTFIKLISLWGNMVVSYSLIPLRVIGIFGLLLMIFGIFYGVFKSYDDYNTYGRLTEFEVLMSAHLFFRGLGMTAVSILGEYVGRIYLFSNKDPQYVIRERIGSVNPSLQAARLEEYKRQE